MVELSGRGMKMYEAQKNMTKKRLKGLRFALGRAARCLILLIWRPLKMANL